MNTNSRRIENLDKKIDIYLFILSIANWWQFSVKENINIKR